MQNVIISTDGKRLSAIHEKIKADRAANEASAIRRGISLNQFYNEREHYMNRVFILKRVWLRSMQERPELTDAILSRMKATHARYISKLKGEI